jgi:hypothetical protein
MLEKKILSTKNTPEISLNPDGIIKITGRSMNGSENDFAGQIEDWVDEYLNNPAEHTCVEIYLEYFNEKNLKIYYTLLRKIETINKKNKKYTINWYYEEGDEDILEKGEKISIALNIPFNFIMIDDPLIPENDLLKWKNSRL